MENFLRYFCWNKGTDSYTRQPLNELCSSQALLQVALPVHWWTGSSKCTTVSSTNQTFQTRLRPGVSSPVWSNAQNVMSPFLLTFMRTKQKSRDQGGFCLFFRDKKQTNSKNNTFQHRRLISSWSGPASWLCDWQPGQEGSRCAWGTSWSSCWPRVCGRHKGQVALTSTVPSFHDDTDGDGGVSNLYLKKV